MFLSVIIFLDFLFLPNCCTVFIIQSSNNLSRLICSLVFV
ncbi:hypothetical protein ES332_A08G247700v1 [Gossypium tomentosum]|uniref:Uncharacterized protein n=1 Tax=Gossypium tomentosum TaxID=34277 RepID=A0A5D2PK48_GOSTO|nr:hypothetical protein ES332_A08G247700v1 [Gossypium tomentosum]